jgi:hypothetical protein
MDNYYPFSTSAYMALEKMDQKVDFYTNFVGSSLFYLWNI